MNVFSSLINIFKKLRETPRGRSILFLVVFFLFLIFVMIYLRLGNDSYNKDVVKKEVIKNDLSFLNNSYNINISLDNNKYLYRIDNTDTYIIKDIINNKTYKKELDNYYIFDNNNWISSNNPNKFYRFSEIDYINKLLDISYYESDTIYKEYKYDKSNNYLLDINNISNIMNGTISDFDSSSDYIKLFIKNNKINGIEYNLDNYCRYNKICSYSLKINIDSN